MGFFSRLFKSKKRKRIEKITSQVKISDYLKPPKRVREVSNKVLIVPKLKLTLYRLNQSIGGTLGILVGPQGKLCSTMEPNWLDNRIGLSCIQEGVYDVHYLKKSASGKYKDAYHVVGVEGRTGILIHKGNVASDTQGCILPGRRHGKLGGRKAVLDSSGAFRDLHKLVGRQSFTLEVKNELI